MFFLLTTISFWRVVLCEFETLGEVSIAMFSQIECTGSSSVVECSVCMIGGKEKGSGDGGCVKIAASPEEASESRHRHMAWVAWCLPSMSSADSC
ncbi:uncharacterized protein MONOS_18289 [Monocercomonoides exilis]|uniref:uncharacterized protein n=1 Tax=Monocercomonoides exilis TaxID=2049356 RepID=UPI00355A276B|nr:hypothetical protein MONOS_18289 [Monocercomonoides exilis]